MKDKVDSVRGIPKGSFSRVELDAGRLRIAILMCTYNGAVFLREQLDSFGKQSYTNWTLYVSDDASTDETRSILSDYQHRWGKDRVIIFNGPCKGFAENFMSLIKRPEVKGDYFAFSDQDDIWFCDKLERALASLQRATFHEPALYCSRTRLVNSVGTVIGMSPMFLKPPSFQNALVQSLAGANTMLINQAARNLLLQVPENAPLVAHDWLAYLLVTGCGGRVIYDTEPCLDYRQHGGNLIGANASVLDRLKRLREMLSGRFFEWTDANLKVLNGMSSYLSVKNRDVLVCLTAARSSSLFKRVNAYRKAGLYRQTLQGNLSLYLAVCIRKI